MKENDLLVYGAGGAGKELALIWSLERSAASAWCIKGFIDDTEGYAGKRINGIPVLGGLEYLKGYHGNLTVTIFDYPSIRRDLIAKIKQNNRITFPTLISTTSLTDPDAHRGEGCIVNYFNFISCNTTLGDFVFVNGRTGIGHDAEIGEYTTIYSGINIGGGASVGACCLIGSGTTILPKIKIGDRSTIGAGSVVTRDVPAGVMAAGVPAKVIKELAFS